MNTAKHTAIHSVVRGYDALRHGDSQIAKSLSTVALWYCVPTVLCHQPLNVFFECVQSAKRLPISVSAFIRAARGWKAGLP